MSARSVCRKRCICGCAFPCKDEGAKALHCQAKDSPDSGGLVVDYPLFPLLVDPEIAVGNLPLSCAYPL